MATVMQSVSLQQGPANKLRVKVSNPSSPTGSFSLPEGGTVNYKLTTTGATFAGEPICFYNPGLTAGCQAGSLPAGWSIANKTPTSFDVVVPSSTTVISYGSKLFINGLEWSVQSYGRIGCCEAQRPFIDRFADRLGISVDAATILLGLGIAVAAFLAARWLPRPAANRTIGG